MSQQPQGNLRLPRSAIVAPAGTLGSQTVLQTEAGPSEPTITLRLRAERDDNRHIQWAEDVIDNEGMGKKSSKVCCIYHKPHEPGDSDSQSDSDSSDSDSDSEPDLSRAHRAGGSKGRKGRRGSGHERKGRKHEDGKGKDRKPSPNAYERQPRSRNK